MKKVLAQILERLKSPIVWSAIAVQIANIAAIYNPSLGDQLKIIIVSIGEIYTLFAVMNNPTDRENF